MTSPPSNDAVSVDGLVKAYGSLRALDGLSFSVARGEFSEFSDPMERAKPQPWEFCLVLLSLMLDRSAWPE